MSMLATEKENAQKAALEAGGKQGEDKAIEDAADPAEGTGKAKKDKKMKTKMVRVGKR